MQGQADRSDRRETWAGDGMGGEEGAFTKNIRPRWEFWMAGWQKEKQTHLAEQGRGGSSGVLYVGSSELSCLEGLV